MPVSKEYIVKRLISLLFVIFGVLVITFIITRVIPARPELLWAGPHATIEQIEKARRALNLDKPIYVQFFLYLRDFLAGNWGVSWRTRTPVFNDIMTSLSATLELVMAGFVIAIIVGIPLGVLAALKRYSRVDDSIKVVSVVGASVPVFWLALIAQLALSNWLGIFPTAKRVSEGVVLATGFRPITGFYVIDSILQGNLPVLADTISHLILPALVLSAYPLCLCARMTRALMIEVLSEQYIRSLKAWGLPTNLVLFKYALKNTIAPVVASLGLSFGYTIVGAFMVEIIFVWPGIGYYAAMSLLSFDYPAIMGCVVVVAIFYSVINTLVDIAHSIIDPRLKL